MTRIGDLALRAETPADRSFARALYGEQRMPELAAVPWPPEGKLRFLADQFVLQEAHYRANHPEADRWIVTRGAEPVGRLYVQRGPRWWGLMEIGLREAERGRGAGSALIAWVIAEAAAACAGVELQVVADNGRAIALYRKLGFREAPPHGPSRLRMRRRLLVEADLAASLLGVGAADEDHGLAARGLPRKTSEGKPLSGGPLGSDPGRRESRRVARSVEPKNRSRSNWQTAIATGRTSCAPSRRVRGGESLRSAMHATSKASVRDVCAL